MPETRHTFCRICEALCGLEATVDGEQIVSLRPDGRHVATRGFACVKGLKQHRMYGSPDRLEHPLERVDGEFRRISWPDAIRKIGARVKAIRGESGPDAIGMYVGTAAGFSVLHPVFAQGFMTGVGSKSMYASATQDCSNKFAVSRLVYGFPFTLPFPDLEHVECLIVVGANPAVSKWSFLQVSNPVDRLRGIESRGGKIWTVDPRRTESARAAGEHVFIRPGTDVFFYLAFLHELIELGAVDRVRVRRFMRGWEELEALARPWTPERAERVTRMPAATLRTMVRSYAEAKGAALYCSTGVNMGGHGALAYWIQEAINAVSGNLDRRGGTLVSLGITDFPAFGKKNGVLMRDDRSRIGDFMAVNDAYPGGVMADEILTPGDRQLRALFVTGGNPLLTMANSGRLREAFGKLDLLVTLDIYRNETGALADFVLPCTDPLQRPDLPFIFPLMLGLQSRPYLQATRAVVPPRGEQRDEASIYLDLARASGAPLFGSWVAQRAMELLRDRQGNFNQERMLHLLLRLCGQPGFESLLEHPHGVARPPHQDESFLGRRVHTDDGKVDLAPAPLMARAAELDRFYAHELEQADTLKLITKRAITTHNSWTHNLPDFVEGDRGTNYLYMHPADAAAAGVEELGLVDVQSATATVRLPVRLLEDLMPGTVALPHGWGHQHADGLGTASRTRGVNVNLLAADGPDQLEPISGMAHLTGIPVEVRPAAGPQSSDSWSGTPDGRWAG